MERVPITKEALEKLRAELRQFKKVERPKNIKAIKEARAHGDLSENAEYHAAKERQSLIAGRMAEFEDAISRSEVIEVVPGPADRVVFGKTVLLFNLDTEEEKKYQLLGKYESDPSNGRISINSPLGMALIGKEVGEEIRFQTPGGLQEFEILEIY